MKTKFTKKSVIALYAMLLCCGCDLQQYGGRGQDIHKANEEECDMIKAKLTYIKDEKTELCFAVLNNYTHGFRSTFAIACVPCDSLKTVGVK